MTKKQLLIAWMVTVLLLSGCAKFSLTKGGGQFTIPFDFPQKKSTETN